MRRNNVWKYALLAAVMLAVLAFAGCTTDSIDTGGNISAGNNASVWVTLTPSPSPTTVPTAASINTPVVLNGATGVIGGIVTPTPTPTTVPVLTVAPNGASTAPGGVTATPIRTATSAPGVLKLNSTGTEVRTIQTYLKKLGYLTGAVDGDFGTATETAVKAFQKAAGLTVDGIVGPTTLARLKAAATATATPTTVLKLGATGTAVRTLQTKLKSLGYFKGTVDGDFGTATEAAVKAFQKAMGLTADGIVGPTTQAKLNTTKVTAKPTASPTPKPTSTPKVSNTYLRYGDSGASVKTMQNRLITLGYLTGTATGNFDKATEAAVIAFQKRNVSYSDGVAGPLTLEKMYSSSAKKASSVAGVIGTKLQEGDSGTAVRTLQSKLKALGYYTASVDGKFGAGTTSAVKAFQRANKLTVDGIAGGGTIAKMYSDNVVTAAAAAKTPTPTPRVTATPRATATPKHTPIGDFNLVTPSPDGNYVTLREGDSGILVINLQNALKDKGYYSGTVDGLYGYETTVAVLAFQSKCGLSRDGVAGPATQRILYEGNYPVGS